MSDLIRTRSKAKVADVHNYDEEERSLENYEPIHDNDFYIVWYEGGDNEYSDKVKGIENLIEDEMEFLEDDEIEDGRWILAWKVCVKTDTADKRAKITWMYIHEIYNEGVESNSAYTKLAVQRSNMPTPKPPFSITDNIQEKFKELICSEKYICDFLGDRTKDSFYAMKTRKKFREFIRDLKNSAAKA